MDDTIFLLFLFGLTSFVFLLIISISYLIYYLIHGNEDLNDSNTNLSNDFKIDLNNFKNLKNFDKFNSLSDIEKITYLLSIAYFIKIDKPNLKSINLNNNISTEILLIRERGIKSFHFLPYYNQINSIINYLIEISNNEEINENSLLINNFKSDFENNQILKILNNLNFNKFFPFNNSPFIIEDLIEINFNYNKFGNYSFSTILNFPLPTVNRKNDIIYFETKLLNFDPLSTLISIGLVTNLDYPNFQLPGYLPYSFAIESTGNLRLTKKKKNFNSNNNTNSSSNNLKDFQDYDYWDYDNELIVLPTLNEGDVIGLGYRSISGTIFLTHNGKLIHEIVKYFKFELYPCIGYKNLKNNEKCKETNLIVNLGQLGFVYIEANVKKLGFCENRNEGIIGAPPLYNKLKLEDETFIAKGDDIPPDYPSEEDDFFITLNSKLRNKQLEISNEIKKVSKIIDNNKSHNSNNNNNSNNSNNSNRNSVKSTTPESEPPSYESEKNELEQVEETSKNAPNTFANPKNNNNNIKNTTDLVTGSSQDIVVPKKPSKNKNKKRKHKKNGNKTQFK